MNIKILTSSKDILKFLNEKEKNSIVIDDKNCSITISKPTNKNDIIFQFYNMDTNKVVKTIKSILYNWYDIRHYLQ
ncbi:hypothetical protein ACR77J_07695 [Tissierella praeacuta]